MQSLKSVTLAGTNVADPGADALQKKRPALEIKR